MPSKKPPARRVDYDEILQEIRTGADRSASILACAWIEDLLEVALRYNLIALSKSEDEGLFAGVGPLSSFSARIRVAHAMGVVSAKLRDDLDALRKIRNDYAHSVLKSKLTDDDRVRLVRKLNAVANRNDLESMPTNEVLAIAVENIGLFLILRTAPPPVLTDSELIRNLACLDYSEVTETKARSHQ
jgi:DNA-binding MltR family transcriptional regulator